MNDLISRQAVLDILSWRNSAWDAYSKVVHLPSAQSEQKKGKWVNNIRGSYCYVCSECGYGFPTDGWAWLNCNRKSDEQETAMPIEYMKNFCPCCGADMRGET